jgi:hypothetical protein
MLTYLTGKIRVWSLRAKLVSIFLLLIIIPVFSVTYIATSTATDELMNKTKENISNATVQTRNYYEIILNNIEQGYVSQIANDPAVTDFFFSGTDISTSEKYSFAASVKKLLQKLGSNYIWEKLGEKNY